MNPDTSAVRSPPLPAGEGRGVGHANVNNRQPVPAVLSASMLERFAREAAKYPAEQKQSAVMACLAIVQAEWGWVSREAESLVASYLGMPPIAVHEVTTFYNMYNQVPVGQYKFNVCTNLPCQLRDGAKALHHLERKLGISMGETTADGMFTLQQSECLGACADSPVMLVNDFTMCSFMSDDKLDQLVDGLRSSLLLPAGEGRGEGKAP